MRRVEGKQATFHNNMNLALIYWSEKKGFLTPLELLFFFLFSQWLYNTGYMLLKKTDFPLKKES